MYAGQGLADGRPQEPPAPLGCSGMWWLRMWGSGIMN